MDLANLFEDMFNILESQIIGEEPEIQPPFNIDDYTRRVTTSSPKECHICYENVIEGVRLKCKCKKIYHSECLERWLQINQTCPICRSNA
jgi:hypothetical protein